MICPFCDWNLTSYRKKCPSCKARIFKSKTKFSIYNKTITSDLEHIAYVVKITGKSVGEVTSILKEAKNSLISGISKKEAYDLKKSLKEQGIKVKIHPMLLAEQDDIIESKPFFIPNNIYLYVIPPVVIFVTILILQLFAKPPENIIPPKKVPLPKSPNIYASTVSSQKMASMLNPYDWALMKPQKNNFFKNTYLSLKNKINSWEINLENLNSEVEIFVKLLDVKTKGIIFLKKIKVGNGKLDIKLPESKTEYQLKVTVVKDQREDLPEYIKEQSQDIFGNYLICDQAINNYDKFMSLKGQKSYNIKELFRDFDIVDSKSILSDVDKGRITDKADITGIISKQGSDEFIEIKGISDNYKFFVIKACAAIGSYYLNRETRPLMLFITVNELYFSIPVNTCIDAFKKALKDFRNPIFAENINKDLVRINYKDGTDKF